MFVLWSAGVNLELWQTLGHSNQSHRRLQPDAVTITQACHLSLYFFLSLTCHSFHPFSFSQLLRIECFSMCIWHNIPGLIMLPLSSLLCYRYVTAMNPTQIHFCPHFSIFIPILSPLSFALFHNYTCTCSHMHRLTWVLSIYFYLYVSFVHSKQTM